MHEGESADVNGKMSKGECLFTVCSVGPFGCHFVAGHVWISLRRTSSDACWFTSDRHQILMYDSSTELDMVLGTLTLVDVLAVGVFFLCANGVWSNSLSLAAVEEACFEALAIVWQLLFIRTLSCRLATSPAF